MIDPLSPVQFSSCCLYVYDSFYFNLGVFEIPEVSSGAIFVDDNTRHVTLFPVSFQSVAMQCSNKMDQSEGLILVV